MRISRKRSGEDPRLVLVVSSGRSGTSTVAGLCKYLGLTIPTPEIPAGATNPKGFFEPQWVVDLQEGLLRRAGAALEDARPEVFEIGDQISARPAIRAKVVDWLESWTDPGAEVVIKDPRSTYFLNLWRDSAKITGAQISYLTMLRHPAEVVGSKQKYYRGLQRGVSARSAQTTRVAIWANVNLFTELRTRGTRRTFVQYADLLSDWRRATARFATDLGLSIAEGHTPEQAAAVDEFIEPDLRRVTIGWDDIDCPDQLRDLAERTWQALLVLSASGGTDVAAESRLDRLREEYVGLHDDAVAVARTAIEAARRTGLRQGRRRALEESGAADQD